MRTIFSPVNKGDLVDYLFALSVELDILAPCVPEECYNSIVDLSDSILSLSKSL